MEPVKHQNHQANLSKFSNTHLLYLFSVILLCSSLFPFIFKLMQLLSCKMGKNYMFLLCNGILVLIVKISGLMNNSQPQETNHVIDESSIKIGGSPKKSIELSELKTEVAEEKYVAMEVKEVQEMQQKSLTVVRNVHLITQDIADDQIEEDEQEEEAGLLSAEELNKKCEDFIRKMKEGIKFEAQQVFVY
ncbi:hypothetical protein P3X46_012058 [Hevea brasiliensis]|uniref:DUF4408 domain-containing protein n=1 Tax=Hevea brasiliensis TaxID=3981 RepID=A0ABQ9MBJ4_HEVBR|nr:uncharacterized protein LOC110668740 [Hevea brasiliensis]KAJ9176780.1 hypothetical protein P3X46_012058 [Hevea brasiliensis]